MIIFSLICQKTVSGKDKEFRTLKYFGSVQWSECNMGRKQLRSPPLIYWSKCSPTWDC